MKKVLALVLAVIMVCTMAFAANVVNAGTIVIGGGNASTTPGETYAQLVPGSTLTVKFNDGTKFYTEGTGANEKLVPAKNTVTVTFSKGAEWVASQGWVQVKNVNTNGSTVSVGTGENVKYYEYQITLKQDYTKAYDEKVCDLSISKITLRADGYAENTQFAETNTSKIVFGVGYVTADIAVAFDANGVLTAPTPANLENGTIYTVKSITVGNKATSTATASKSYPAVGGTGMTADIALAVGQKMLYVASANGVSFVEGVDKGYKEAELVAPTTKGFNEFNTTAKVVFNQGAANADKVYNVYAKDLSGKVTKLAATLDRGVLTFNVPALSAFIITTGSVTATAVEPATPGNTTNPGTGANDVVGVAAALAVVALVSGAAISLKK